MFWAALLAGVFAGCSAWTTIPAGKSLLQPARMSPDSVVVEFAMLDLDTVPEERIGELWRAVDEQQISVETRQRLAQHGFRCGVAGSQLPLWLTDALASQSQQLKLDESEQTAVVCDLLTQRRIQCRANQRRSVPVSTECKELIVGGDETDGAPSRKFADARCHVCMTVSPKGDGQVELQLVPEIQHGPMHQRWVGQDGLFRLDAARNSDRFEELRVAVTLLPGQTLVYSATAENGGLGPAFAGKSGFGAPSSGKLILFRLAQTQWDDLFSPQQTRTPIATQPP